MDGCVAVKYSYGGRSGEVCSWACSWLGFLELIAKKPILKLNFAEQLQENVLIAGDFNARNGIHCNWSLSDRATHDTVVDQDGRRWLYMLRVASVYLLNGNVDGDREAPESPLEPALTTLP